MSRLICMSKHAGSQPVVGESSTPRESLTPVAGEEPPTPPAAPGLPLGPPKAVKPTKPDELNGLY